MSDNLFTFQSNLLEQLNPMQRSAVEKTSGPLLVLAGAGSGKTRVLTTRIGYLIEQRLAKPWEILAVTFTNKAAAEMKSRIEHLLQQPVDGLWIGTFHSVCARIMRAEAERIGYTSNFTIYDADDQLRLIQMIMKDAGISTELLKPRTVQYTISANKNKLRSARDYAEKVAVSHSNKLIATIFEAYEKRLHQNNAMDFDDLLLKPLDIFTKYDEVLEKYRSRFKYVLVDEYQDTNKAQYHLIQLLSAAHQNICVVGDEDQSIYRWRGADIENILTFEKDYPQCEVVRLEQNYRSTQIILDAANAVVAHNTKRLGKNLWSERDSGDKITLTTAADEHHEAAQVVDIIADEHGKGIQYNDVAILYRTNAQSRALEDQLRKGNIPYTLVGGTRFYERKEVKDCLAYLRILVNQRDDLALRRIINVPTRGIGLKSVDRIGLYAADNNMSFFEAANNAESVPDLGKAASSKVLAFIQQIEAYAERAQTEQAYQVAREVIGHFGLQDEYSRDTTPENVSRHENIVELLNGIARFTETRPAEDAILPRYLEEISLLTDIDRWDPDASSVTLMTLHSAKGLEFPTIIICGLEHGLFPLFRSMESQDDQEEERRLFYVGMTRAQDRLHLLYANTRRRFTGNNHGSAMRNTASPYLLEIPQQHLIKKGGGQPYYESLSGSRNFSRANRRAASAIESEGAFKIGDWVRHDSFGKGQVLGVEKTSSMTKLSILFANKQLKKIVVEYADLEKIE